MTDRVPGIRPVRDQCTPKGRLALTRPMTNVQAEGNGVAAGPPFAVQPLAKLANAKPEEERGVRHIGASLAGAQIPGECFAARYARRAKEG